MKSTRPKHLLLATLSLFPLAVAGCLQTDEFSESDGTEGELMEQDPKVLGTVLHSEEFDREDRRFTCTKTTCSWTSDEIDVSGATGLNVSFATQGTTFGAFESADYLKVMYRVDQGLWVNILDHRDDLAAHVVAASVSTSGTTLQIRIQAKTSARNETYEVRDLVVTAATGGGATDGTGDTTGGTGSLFSLPPLNADLDYQLGGAYTPAANVKTVSRDRTESIAKGHYNICYVNGFQVQPDEEALWMNDHPELILRDRNGNPVIDSDWDEMLIDVRTVEKRSRVAKLVGAWIEGCAKAGFNAVEIDNLDSFTRSGGLLTEDQAVAMMALFSSVAHANGLAIAQKNSAELVPRRAAMGTDFVVAEECNRYNECGAFTAGYGDHVLVVEYRRADFTKGCAQYPKLSIVLRDVNLVTPTNGAYVFDGC